MSRTSRRELLVGAGLTGGAITLSTAAAAQTLPAPARSCGLAQVPADDDQGPTVSQVWGQAVAEARFDVLPAEVVRRAKWCLLDNLAVLAYGAHVEEVDIYLGRAIQRGGAGEARVAVRGSALPVEDVSACNAYLIHAKEIDDNDFRGAYRPSCVAIPPVLAVADWKRSTGQEVITATAIAYSLTGRLAAMAPNMQQFGFMPSAIFGSTGGAAAAAHLMKLDAERTAWAIGLGAAAGGGLFQYYLDQTEEKKLHVARTSRSAVEMAIMADRGFVGPHRAIEGLAGMNAYLQGRDIRMRKGPLIEDVRAWEGPLHIVPKFFAASASIGPFLDVLDPVWRASGARAEDIDHFVIAREWPREGVAGRKVVDFHAPGTITGAQLDMAYSIALYLVTGDAGPDSFTEARLRDPAILGLADKTEYRQVPQVGPYSTEVVLKDGRVIAAPFTYPSGDVTIQPLMEEARLKKIERITDGILTDSGRQQLFDAVMGLDRVDDVREWMTRMNGLLNGH